MVINIAGLGIALAFCIFAFENYQYAYSFDQWHPDKERIFRVEAYKSSNHLVHGVCPATLPPQALAEIPGVEAATRIDSRGVVIKRGDNVFNHEVHLADENFLDIFRFELVSGQVRLADRSAVLINEEMAEKFFGKENPVGQPLLFYSESDQRKNLIVSGVMKNTPKNSSIRFQFLTHLDNQLEGDKPVRYDSWRWMVDAGFLKLKSAADAPAVEAALQRYVEPQNQGNQNWHAEKYRLEPLPVIAQTAREVRWNNLGESSPPAAIWGNIVLAVMLLLTACLNFANTTLAIGNRRLREMGVRKVMGGTLNQIRLQLLGEAFIVCVAALIVGMTLVFPLVDGFNAMWKHLDVKITYLNNYPMLAFLVGTVVVTTLLAGAYPAFYISRFSPSGIFRGTLKFGGASIFSRILMGLQVAMAVTTIVAGLSFARNARMQRDADIGYARDGIVGVETRDLASLQKFEDAIRNNPKVVEIAKTRHHAGFGFRRTEFKYQGETAETQSLEVGKDYLPVMGMKVVAGTDFSAANAATGSETEVLVNETFVKEIGGNRPVIGEMLNFDTVSYRIAGVVQDFLADSPFDGMAPAVMRCSPEKNLTYCIIKTRPEDMTAVYADMEKIWKELFPYLPYTGFYQNEVMANSLEVSENLFVTMTAFSLISLLLTISGLFAIVSLNAHKQLRSLALRRVLGATAGNIAFHLNRNLLLVVVASILAGCFGGRLLTLTLMNSIFKMHFGAPPVMLLFAFIIITATLFITIGLKVWQVLKINVMEALKTE